MRKYNIVALLFLSMLVFNSCSLVKSVTQSLLNLEKLQFKLQNVDGFAVSGINLKDKSSISDFSIMDGVKLTKAFASKSFPVSFVLNVAALNPNDGKNGGKQTTATLSALDWQLYIDDVPTINGNINSPIEIPGSGQSTIIPMRMSLDLYKYFDNKGYDGLVNLAMALGGVNGSAARIKLDAKPTVSTPLGPINYPGRITIIDKKFSS